MEAGASRIGVPKLELGNQRLCKALHISGKALLFLSNDGSWSFPSFLHFASEQLGARFTLVPKLRLGNPFREAPASPLSYALPLNSLEQPLCRTAMRAGSQAPAWEPVSGSSSFPAFLRLAAEQLGATVMQNSHARFCCTEGTMHGGFCRKMEAGASRIGVPKLELGNQRTQQTQPTQEVRL
ncbi:MAG: hypothetical protein C4519_25085 [Desulfobacteraceae bacterium]|nr:MAG: hypothetical protein C4519_25085 [Desulfobacteraceae bacterium]